MIVRPFGRAYRTESTPSTDGAKEAGLWHWCCSSFCLTSQYLRGFYVGQFLIRPVWRKISICKINLNQIIQKSKLKRNRQDEMRFYIRVEFCPHTFLSLRRFWQMATLPKVQRTRGLSSAYQSYLF